MSEHRTYDRCDQCHEAGELGTDLRAHAVEVPGERARFVVVLHVERCAAEWFEKYGADPMSAIVHKCAQCKEQGRLGPEVRAYQFVKPDGASYVAFLHASDGGRKCYAEYDARYRRKYEAAKAKGASNG